MRPERRDGGLAVFAAPADVPQRIDLAVFLHRWDWGLTIHVRTRRGRMKTIERRLLRATG
jgi:hypothetical protein